MLRTCQEQQQHQQEDVVTVVEGRDTETQHKRYRISIRQVRE